MKERPILFSGPMVGAILEGRKTQTRRIQNVTVSGCPYGKPGDRLWVRESWAKVPQTAYWHDQTIPHQVFDENGYKWWAIYRVGWERSSPGWKRSIHMPRWASRILLEVVSVRAERLNDISDDDCFAEGVRCPNCGYTAFDCALHLDHHLCSHATGSPSPIHNSYRELWESINGQGSWADNPWVWVIEFKVIQP